MNDKRILIAAVVGVVIITIGGFFVFGRKNNTTTLPEEQIEQVESLDASTIGLKLVVKADKKNVRLIIENVTGINHIEYEITYDADSRDKEARAEGVKVPRGFSDEKELSGTSSPFESKDYFLGTCSSGTCVADAGVTSVKAIVKVTKVDGKVYQSEASVDL